VALVLPTGQAPEALLSVLSGDSAPDSGMITVDGRDVRTVPRGESLCTVWADSGGFNVSIADLLHAGDATLTPEQMMPLLSAVGLDYLGSGDSGYLGTPLGPSGGLLTPDERQRLTLAVALAMRPRVLMLGPLVAMADPDTALAIISKASLGLDRLALVATTRIEVADAADVVLYANPQGAWLAPHQRLLTTVPSYAEQWHGRLQTSSVDLSALGVSAETEQHLRTRLVTQSFAAHATIYRQGSPADRTYFIISGNVEIAVAHGHGQPHRVAVLGPGMHCGDLRLSPDERRAESAKALNDTVVRALSREAISAGMFDVLDQPLSERRIMLMLLRNGPATTAELAGLLPEVDTDDLQHALTHLLGSGKLTQRDGHWHVPLTRRRRRGAPEIHDRLGF
jgi:CRP-like cAMP-binding protein